MSKFGKHVGNEYDPRRHDAREKHVYRDDPDHTIEQRIASQRQQWQDHLDWLKQFRFGPPQATETVTQDQMLAMGMIGLYIPE